MNKKLKFQVVLQNEPKEIILHIKVGLKNDLPWLQGNHHSILSLVNGLLHNGRVAAFAPGEPGSNPGEGQYIM